MPKRPTPADFARHAARAGCALLALALAAAAVGCLFVNPDLVAWRAGALAVGLVLGLWRVRDGMLACVFLTPLLGMLPRGLGVNDLSLPEHLLLPLLACAALRVACSRAPRRATAIDRPLVIYMALVAVSAARALGEYWAAGMAPRALVGPPLAHHFSYTILDFANGPFLVVHYTVVALEGALWFGLLTAPGTAMRAAPLRGALVLSAATVALVGAAQAIWHFQMVPFFEQVQPGLHRINATLPDPNTLGAFLVLLWPLGLVAALRWGAAPADGGRRMTDRRRSSSLLGLLWSGLVLYVLLRSVSRTAWASLALMVVAATAVAGWRPAVFGLRLPAATARFLRRAPIVLLIAGGLAVAVVSAGGVGRDIVYRGVRSPAEMLVYTLDARRPAADVLPARFDHWQAAIGIWRAFPLLGAGIGKYALLKGRYLPEARARWLFFTEPHNYYLKVLCELGIAGLAAFLLLLASIGAQARRAWRVTDGPGRQRVAAVAAGLVGFLLCLLAQDPLILREMQYVFWAVVALLVLEAREGPGVPHGAQCPPVVAHLEGTQGVPHA